MADRVILVNASDDHVLLRHYEDVLAEVRADHPDVDVAIHLAADLQAMPDLRTGSLFGGPTIVAIRNVEKAGTDLKEGLEDYLASPDPEAVLILTSANAGTTRKVTSLVKEVGRVVSGEIPKPWDDNGWRDLVRQEFRRLKRRADPSAVEEVWDRAGTSPALIASHVQQVCASHPDADTLTSEHVADVIDGFGDQGVFAIVDAAMLDRDPGRTVQLVRGALASGVAPLALLGLLTTRVRDLMVARAGLDLAEAKTRPDRPGGAARVNPGQVKRLAGQASQWAVGELQWCHDLIARTDIRLKGDSELPAEVVIELALLDIATRREPGSPWDPRTPATIA